MWARPWWHAGRACSRPTCPCLRHGCRRIARLELLHTAGCGRRHAAGTALECCQQSRIPVPITRAPADIGGAFTAYLPPGVWTTYGRALGEPVGRVHWWVRPSPRARFCCCLCGAALVHRAAAAAPALVSPVDVQGRGGRGPAARVVSSASEANTARSPRAQAAPSAVPSLCRAGPAPRIRPPGRASMRVQFTPARRRPRQWAACCGARSARDRWMAVKRTAGLLCLCSMIKYWRHFEVAYLSRLHVRLSSLQS